MYIGGLNVRHQDDPMLDGVAIPEALLADDIMLPSTSPEGLQAKLDMLTTYFNGLGMRVNPSKSKIMRLGLVRPHVPFIFSSGGTQLQETLEYKYVGFPVVGGKSAKWQTGTFVDKCIHKARTVATSLLHL